ncbi:C40 family peptidase [Hyphomonas pacifica]|uniref:C40 family peptidase n=1 Tax=Hyphomonas pacifica TaxID=1280941 RepID=UPI000DBF9833|nr:NlpC/P60 family protein [Hyphomonas pacifica]RAN33744.1 hypothetical protein HY11_03365 [Hyphomonas pacifica]
MPEFDDKRLKLPEGELETCQVTAAVANIYEGPDPAARLSTQALHGEFVYVDQRRDGFARVQCQRDRYVGWALLDGLSETVFEPSHKICSRLAHAYSNPDLKSPPKALLSLGARLTISGREGDWLHADRAGWVHKRHVAALTDMESDPAAIAERFLGTPYLWGGRQSVGMDCTGLTQQAYEAVGVLLPRDSDMQYAWTGRDITEWREPGALRRGDLVFWKGHVGIMTDAEHILHANAWHMAVAVEPLKGAITRIANYYAEPIGARRIDVSSERRTEPAWKA